MKHYPCFVRRRGLRRNRFVIWNIVTSTLLAPSMWNCLQLNTARRKSQPQQAFPHHRAKAARSAYQKCKHLSNHANIYRHDVSRQEQRSLVTVNPDRRREQHDNQPQSRWFRFGRLAQIGGCEKEMNHQRFCHIPIFVGILSILITSISKENSFLTFRFPSVFPPLLAVAKPRALVMTLWYSPLSVGPLWHPSYYRKRYCGNESKTYKL